MITTNVTLLFRAILTAILCSLCVFFVKLYKVRSYVKSLQKQGLPMPPHHWLFGHLKLSADIMKASPPYAHGVYVGDQVRQKYPELNSAFYLDIWPFGTPILIVLRPDLFYQFTQARQLPKDPGLRSFLGPLTGKETLVTMEGTTWKHWKSIFSSGFSASHVGSLVPDMVKKVQVFRQLLKERVSTGEMFHLDDMTLSLTIDIIGGAVMDHDFQSQVRYNDMTAALRRQIRWCNVPGEVNPIDKINIFRPFVHMYNTWRMNKYLGKKLRERYNTVSKGRNPGKSVIDLALQAYLSENPSTESIPPPFKEAAMAQIKLFIFAGHDTTSSAVVFTYHLLSQHPTVLDRVRAEHDSVLGTSASQAASVLASKPQLLNQLPYTLAAVKEALRIFPTVAALRQGQSDFSLIGKDGQRFPTNGCLVWGDHYGIHHNPHVWPRVEEYLPERWLCGEDDPLYPPKNAWRPFEKGTRNCIGQELALAEIKIILALTIREFDIVDAYADFDSMKGNPKNMNVNGHRAYMVRMGGAGGAANGYPCRVRMSEWEKKTSNW